MMNLSWLTFTILSLLSYKSQAFLMTPNSCQRHTSSTSTRLMSSESNNVDNILGAMHESGYKFRLVVVGNGAILETTEALGPVMKSSTSAKTGARLTTFASSDQSFEFHVNLDKIANVSFVETVKPVENGEDKVLRICRFINEEGKSACSLILADSSEDATKWFDGMKTENESK